MCERPDRDLIPMLERGRAAVAGLTWPQLVPRAVRWHREEIDRARVT
jgi:hypothetical protein